MHSSFHDPQITDGQFQRDVTDVRTRVFDVNEMIPP